MKQNLSYCCLFKMVIILILFLPLVKVDVFACMDAHQNRLFPLGKSSEGYIFFEIHLSRGDDGNDIEWGGQSYITIYDENHKKIRSEFISRVSLKDRSYTSELRPLFEKALKRAKEYHTYLPAIPKDLLFCNYGENCSYASVLINKKDEKLYLKLHNGKKYLVSILNNKSSISKDFIEYYSSFDENILDYVLVNSVRRIIIGEKHMTIVHIGYGQSFVTASGERDFSGKEDKSTIIFESLEKSLFVEPVMHHGHGFDFFIIE